MIEILNIFFLFFVFSLISFFNVNKNTLSINVLNNIILFINLSLFFSFINHSSQFFLIGYIIFCLIIFFTKFDKLSFINLKKGIKHNSVYLILLITIFFILSVDIIVNLKLGWDAQNFIFSKTLHFINDGSFSDLAKLDQPHYSHLGSYLWAIFWNNGFFSNEYNGRLFYLFFFLISLFNFCNYFQNKKIFILSILIFLIFFYKYKYFFGAQEILNFSLFLILSSTIYRRCILNEKVNFFEYILLINLFMWFKNESIIILFLIIFYFIFFSGKLISNKEKLILFSSSILLFLLRIGVFFYIDNKVVETMPLFDYQFDKTFSITAEIFFDNLKIVSYYFAGNIFVNPYLLLSYLLTICVIIFRSLLSGFGRSFLMYCIIFHTIFTYVAFMFNFYDVEFQTRVAMDRFLISTCGIYSLVYLIIYNKFKLQNDTKNL
ncbi:hypothetical protein N9S67_02045 [Candidatus Pelagibacter sp.]|nr:hypothetical protein [Candidatus Pelagibacter sp.]